MTADDRLSGPPAPEGRPRISLRPAWPGDAVLLQSWRKEASVKRFQPLAAASVAQLRAELSSHTPRDLYRSVGDKFQWLVLVDGEPAGWITLVVTNWDHGLAEVGYALSTAYQRRGVMPEAITLLLADLFLNTRLERIEARCTVDNDASQRVLERVGFAREGRLRKYFVLGGRRVDNYLYAVLREDFAPRPE